MFCRVEGFFRVGRTSFSRPSASVIFMVCTAISAVIWFLPAHLTLKKRRRRDPELQLGRPAHIKHPCCILIWGARGTRTPLFKTSGGERGLTGVFCKAGGGWCGDGTNRPSRRSSRFGICTAVRTAAGHGTLSAERRRGFKTPKRTPVNIWALIGLLGANINC